MSERNTQGGKVQQVMEKWGLEDNADELERRWLGQGREEHSLRELTAHFNRQILTEALTETGTVPVEGEVENFYRLLTGEDVTKANKIQAEQRLSELGLDSEELVADFVSHQTMYRYLQNHREVEKQSQDQSTSDLIETVRRANARLTNRLKSVVRKNLETLNNRSDFTVGKFDIYVTVQVSCSECNTTRELKQILERNGCECQ